MGFFKMAFNVVKQEVVRYQLKVKWKKRNKHNYTHMKNVFDINSVCVGKATYGGIRVVNYSNDRNLRVSIGNYCSIADDVTFLLAGEHNLNTVSTYPFIAKIIDPGEKEAGSRGDIIVEDDVWFGQNAMVLSGVKIGQGAVIAAGAVVNKNVPPYAIVAGVPACVIKYRFSEDVISQLLSIDYKQLDEEIIINNKEVLYMPVTKENVCEILSKLK